MSPLVNAILGVLYLMSGGAATFLMYHLRGGPAGGAAASGQAKSPAPRLAAKPASVPKPAPVPKVAADAAAAPAPAIETYLAAWKRAGDEREEYFDDIQAMATTGQTVIEPMRTRQKTTSWNDVLIMGAQLARLPLNDDEPVSTRTVIGPRAAKPLVLDTPILVSHMSYGALSREIKTALARGSAAVGTAICSGEGGLLEDEFQQAHRFVLEYVPNQYSITDENLQRVHAVEIKIGQSAKPGMGGLLPASKVTAEIAAVRGREAGRDIHSPARLPNVRTPADLRELVAALRARSGGCPIGVKIAAGHVEEDLAFALQAEPDFITLDGRAGATGAAPRVVKDATSVPTVHAICRARRFLDQQVGRDVTLIVTGGMRVAADFAKALALGADAVAVATAALIASGCQQYRICHTGRCPVGITTQDPQLRARLDVELSSQRLANFLRVSTDELKMFARLTGHGDVHDLSLDDVCTTNTEIASATRIAHV